MRFFMRRNPLHRELEEVRERIAEIQEAIKRIEASSVPASQGDSAEAYRSVFQVRTAMALEELIQNRAQLAQLQEREAALRASIPPEELAQIDAAAEARAAAQAASPPAAPSEPPPIAATVPQPPEAERVTPAPPEAEAAAAPLVVEVEPSPAEEEATVEVTPLIEERPVVAEEAAAVPLPPVVEEAPVTTPEPAAVQLAEQPVAGVPEAPAPPPRPPEPEVIVAAQAPGPIEGPAPVAIAQLREKLAGPPGWRPRVGTIVLAAGVALIAGSVVGGFFSGVIRIGGEPTSQPTAPALAVAPTSTTAPAPTDVPATPVPPTPVPPTATSAPTAVPAPTPAPPTPAPAPTPEPAVAAAPEPVAAQPQEPPIGTAVVEAPAGFSAVYLRAVPTVSGRSLGLLPDGTRLEVLGGTARGDGFRWVEVRTADGTEGWVVAVAVGR